MIQPLRRRRDYTSVGRKAFYVEALPDGALPIYDKDPKYVLARSEQREGKTFKDAGSTAEACFAFEYGKGRLCYLAPGHMISVMWNKEYEKLQKNAVRWLLRET